MSLWKKMATPPSGTQRMTLAAVATNHARQLAKSSSGTSETSGNDVITLVAG
jgi:hypothetical protein